MATNQLTNQSKWWPINQSINQSINQPKQNKPIYPFKRDGDSSNQINELTYIYTCE